MKIGEVSVETVEKWLERHASPVSRITGIKRLSTLFSFAIRQGWMRENPCRCVERMTIDVKTPTILSPEQAAHLMAVVRAKRPRGLAWFTLALFAGLRPEEAERTPWTAIDLENGIVKLDASLTKTRRRRIINLMPAAIAWLKLARELDAVLPLPHWTKRDYLRLVRKELGFDQWPADLLRHTAASYLLAEVRDLARVSLELGNSPGILMRHYVELATKERARAFWGIMPNAFSPEN